ncbi:MAG: sugar ABC transporter ATP-binding protein [Synergistaceae bacterium]|jgi:simple sugar transport system ATP-binding protein|nr:sugar ABC transporter ATP-binding protein [Synergistaceae bacterium]
MDRIKAILSLRGIGKRFYGNRVLSDVSFDVAAGQILGLVGENGAGKSTLMKILFSMPEIHETGGYEGSILWNDREVRFKGPSDALEAGIGMVHQEFSLIPGFSTTENIFLNRESLHKSVMTDIFGSRIRALDRENMTKLSQRAIDKLGVPLDPGMLVKEMPVGHKQFTEIVREISRDKVKLIVLDEPTAVLTESEAEVLLSSLRLLAAEGIAIIFISHRLREVVELCDWVVVLRDGKKVEEFPARGSSVKTIASLMVGREVETQEQAETRVYAEGKEEPPALSVERLWVDMPGETVRDVTFSVKKGEIFGIGGLAGQGKLGIPNGIMGLAPAGGTVALHGKPMRLGSPRTPLELGMAFVSEDRRDVGLLLDEGIDWNITFSAMQVQNKFLKPILGGLFQWRSDGEMFDFANEYIRLLDIKCTGPRQRVGNLSGGNQQKVCLAKAFALRPDVLFVSEPTRGIDVGAKFIVLETLKKYNSEYGTTIVIISSELEELRSVCRRIAVVYEGRIEGILPHTAPLSEFGILMAGAKDEGPKDESLEENLRNESLRNESLKNESPAAAVGRSER